MALLMPPPIVAAGEIVDSLGRSWDSDEHPRDRKGKFIHTMRMIRAFLTPDGSDAWATGEVSQINGDGSIRMKVTKVADQATNGHYIGQMVDVKPDSIENVNEKASLAKAKASTEVFGKWDFSDAKLSDFFADAGLNADQNDYFSDLNVTKRALEDLKVGKKATTTQSVKYHLGLYASENSGPGKPLSDSDYMEFLEALDVDPDVIDDTPDGMSGLKYLADQVNAGRSPNNNNKSGIDWYREVPPVGDGVVREARLQNGDVRLRWYNDGTQAVVWPDGNEVQHDKNKGSLLEAGYEAHSKPGTSPDEPFGVGYDPNAKPGKGSNLGPDSKKINPLLDDDGNYIQIKGKVPEEEEVVDIGDDGDDYEDTPEPEYTDFDRNELDTISARILNRDYSTDWSDSVDRIADGLEDGSIDRNEAHAQLISVSDEMIDEGEYNDDDELVHLGESLNAEARTLLDGPAAPVATLQEDDDEKDIDVPVEELDESIYEGEIEPDPEAEAEPVPFKPTMELTHDEMVALNEYQAASDDLNDTLRYETDDNTVFVGDLKKNVDALDGLIAKNELDPDVPLYRGLTVPYDDEQHEKYQEFLDSLVPGAIVTDRAYMSTSTKRTLAQAFMENMDGDTSKPSVLFEIEVPPGTHGLDVNKTILHSGEDEVILGRKSNLEILSKEEQEDGSYLVKARVLLDGAHPEAVEAPEGTEVTTESHDTGFPDPPETPEEDIISKGWTDLYGGPITDEEKEAIHAYGKLSFHPINHAYRTGIEDNLSDELKTTAAGLDSLLSRMRTKKDETLFRGLRPSPMDEGEFQAFVDQLVVGATFQDNGFLSTSKNDETATEFMGGMEGSVLFSLDIPAGTPAIDVDFSDTSLVLHEQEMILPRGLEFEIVEIKDYGVGKEIVARLKTGKANEGEPESVPGDIEEAPPGDGDLGVPGDGDSEVGGPDGLDAGPDQGDTAPAAGDESQEVIDATGWTKVGEQGGSNLGGFYEDEDGFRHYVKAGKTPHHAKNESLAVDFYNEAGVRIAEQNLAKTPFEGRLGTASPQIPGAKQDLSSHLSDPDYLEKLHEGFAVDAWLANWDVAGLVYDNVVTDQNGDPVRVDPGGALWYRAMGENKGGAFTDEVGEIERFKTKGQAAGIFSSITPDAERASAQRVLDISPERIDEIVDAMNFGEDDMDGSYYGAVDPDALKAKLKARREFIADYYGLALPEAADGDYTPDLPADEVPEDIIPPGDPWATDPVPEAGTSVDSFNPVATYELTVQPQYIDRGNYDTFDELYEAANVKVVDESLDDGYVVLQGKGADLHELWLGHIDSDDDGQFYENAELVDVTAQEADKPESSVQKDEETGQYWVDGEGPFDFKEDAEKYLDNQKNLGGTDDSVDEESLANALGEPGPGSTDWEKMVDDQGAYRWSKDNTKVRIGQKVKSLTDGLEGTIHKFEKNHDGAVVLGTDGKKRGRKVKKLELLDGDTTPVAVEEATSEPDAVHKPLGGYNLQNIDDHHGFKNLNLDQQQAIFDWMLGHDDVSLGSVDDPEATFGNDIAGMLDAIEDGNGSLKDIATYFRTAAFSGHEDSVSLLAMANEFDPPGDVDFGPGPVDIEPQGTMVESLGHEPLAPWEMELLGVDEDGLPTGAPPPPKYIKPLAVNFKGNEAEFKDIVTNTINEINNEQIGFGHTLFFPDVGFEMSYEQNGDDESVWVMRKSEDQSEVVAFDDQDMQQYGDEVYGVIVDTINNVPSGTTVPPPGAVTPGLVKKFDTFNPTQHADIDAIDDFMKSMPVLEDGDYMEFPDGYVLRHSSVGKDLTDRIISFISPQGELLGQWEPIDYGKAYDGDEMAADIEALTNNHKGVAAADASVDTPNAPTYQLADLSGIRDEIPKQIGQVKSKYGITDEYTAKQFRNVGYALDDMMNEIPQSPEWNKAYNRAVYLLGKSGPAGEPMLQKLNDWHVDITGEGTKSTPTATAVPSAGEVDFPAGTKGNFQGTQWTKDENGNWVSQYDGIVTKGDAAGMWDAIQEDAKMKVGDPMPPKTSLPEDKNYAKMPPGAVAVRKRYDGTFLVKFKDGSHAFYQPNGSMIAVYGAQVDEAYNSADLWAPAAIHDDDQFPTPSPDVTNTLPDGYAPVPPGGTVKLKTTLGDPDVYVVQKSDGTYQVHYSTGETYPISESSYILYANDKSQWEKVVAPTEAPQPKPKTGPNMPGSDGKPIYIGDKVKSTTDGETYTVVKFEANGTGMVVQTADGKKKARKANKLKTLENHLVQAPEVHKDHPMYGQPQPEPPTLPDAPFIDNWVSENWLEGVAATYKASNGKELSQSKNWSRYESVTKNGNQGDLDWLKSKGFITDEQHSEASAQIAQHNDDQADHVAAVKEAKLAYAKELGEWAYANGYLGSDHPALFQLKGMDGAKKFSTNTAGHTWGMKHWLAYNQNSVPSSIRHTIESYMGSGYSTINGGLQGLKEKSLQPGTVSTSVKNIDKYMEDAPRVPEDVIVVRGNGYTGWIDPVTKMSVSLLAGDEKTRAMNDMKGTIQTNWGYQSATPGNVPGYKDSAPVWMYIRVPAGAKAGYVTGGISGTSPGEYEILLDRGYRFYVHNVTYGTPPNAPSGYSMYYGDKWIMEVEVVPPGWVPPTVPGDPEVFDATGDAYHPGSPGAPDIFPMPGPGAAPAAPAGP